MLESKSPMKSIDLQLESQSSYKNRIKKPEGEFICNRLNGIFQSTKFVVFTVSFTAVYGVGNSIASGSSMARWLLQSIE